MTAPAASPFAMSVRILAGSLMGALLFIGIALAFVSSEPLLTAPFWWVTAAQVVAGIAVHVMLEAIGYRAAPLDPSMSDDEATRAAQQRWQAGMVTRFAVSEFIAIVSVAAAFVLAHGLFLTYVGGAVVSLLLMLVHVWPGRRPVGKVADALESNGKPSHLREAFGYAQPGGAVQRL